MVLRDSLILTAIGAMIGVPLALLTGRALASALFDVKPNDLASVLFALGGIAAVAVGGSFIPARRAAAIDPLTALRSE
jgi:ABC-type antimicrobial peptide transport system permease subunit